MSNINRGDILDSLFNEYYKQFALEKDDNTTKAREFCKEVEKLAKKFNLSFFLVTEGASIIRNNNCPAVKAARDAHIE